jgi:hypothetical protein
MVQPIGSITVNPANQNVVNIQPQNVGLTLGFLVIASLVALRMVLVLLLRLLRLALLI